MTRTLNLSVEDALEVSKALANQHRLQILKLLSNEPLDVNDISKKLGIPFSTTAINIKKLEEAGLLATEIVPGRGSRKVSSKKYDRIAIDLSPEEPESSEMIIVEMPIGEYVDCDVEPTCGLLSETDYLGLQDEPRSFYEPDHKRAQLLWFKSGYVEYKFPNRVPYGAIVNDLELTAELCSEAPYSRLEWPSDITFWVNGIEIGTWTSPSDFGGERGFLTPSWWETHNTQFGLLKRIRVNENGSFVDGSKISEVTIKELDVNLKPYTSIKLGVKKDAVNKGGMNLFGKTFGNYEQDLIMKIQYMNQ